MWQSLANVTTLTTDALAVVQILMRTSLALISTEVTITVASAGICMLRGCTLKSTDGAPVRARMLKAVCDFSQLSANVTIAVTRVFVFMSNVHSRCAALVAVYIKARGIFVRNDFSRISARIAYEVAVVIVNMLCFSRLATQVARGITIVIKGMWCFAFFFTFRTKFRANVNISVHFLGISLKITETTKSITFRSIVMFGIIYDVQILICIYYIRTFISGAII
jgi:hypothetical protein